MGKDFDEFRRIVGRAPWLTSRGIDLTKFPLDDILRGCEKMSCAKL